MNQIGVNFSLFPFFNYRNSIDIEDPKIKVFR